MKYSLNIMQTYTSNIYIYIYIYIYMYEELFSKTLYIHFQKYSKMMCFFFLCFSVNISKSKVLLSELGKDKSDNINPIAIAILTQQNQDSSDHDSDSGSEDAHDGGGITVSNLLISTTTTNLLFSVFDYFTESTSS